MQDARAREARGASRGGLARTVIFGYDGERKVQRPERVIIDAILSKRAGAVHSREPNAGLFMTQ
jgi:hypothetical protein